MTRPVPTRYSTSPRLPRKICGLFDYGFAGGTLDVTSSDSDASTDLTCDPVSPDDLESGHFKFLDSVSGIDAFEEKKLTDVHPHFFDTYDMPDSSADFETDQLLDDSLDALTNLDQFLIGGIFLNQPLDTEPIHDVPAFDEITPMLHDVDVLFQKEPSASKSRKRKATGELFAIDVFKSHTFETPMADIFEVKPSTYSYQENECQRASEANDEQIFINDESKEKLIVINDNIDNSFYINVENEKKQITIDDNNEKAIAVPLQIPSSLALCTTEEIPDKNLARQMKNKVTTKKPQEHRKHKFSELDEEAERLIKANANLRVKIVELEKVVTEMKAQLFAKMIGK